MDFIDNVNVSADILREKSPAIVAMDKIIKRDLIEISREIKHAYEIKKEVIYYELMSHFDIPNTTNTNSQRYIYSNIIDALKLKGFTVKLICIKAGKNKKDKTYKLYISWLREEDLKERVRQDQIINNALTY